MLNPASFLPSPSSESLAATVADIAATLADPAVRKRLARVIVRTIGERGETEDIISDVAVRALADASKYDWTRGSIIGWLCRMATSMASNSARAARNRLNNGGDRLNDQGEMECAFESMIGTDGRYEMSRAADLAALRKAISALDTDSQTFLDCLAGGMSKGDAGAVVGWEKSKTSRKVNAIRERLLDAL